MLREETVFGPIFSRRLGTSLGINLLPEKGKFCNFDCIYCECGWNRDGRNDSRLPSAEKVRHDLSVKLQDLYADNVKVDSITFSGDGEPTLNPEFPQIIDDTLALRDRFAPSAKVSVLSNATRVHIPEVFNALRKVDNPIMKIDAPTNDLIARINHPAPGYDIARVIDALKQFHGDFVLQWCLLREVHTSDNDNRLREAHTPDNDNPSLQLFDSTADEVVLPMLDIIRQLHPREVMAYTIDRPTPAQNLAKVSPDEMRSLLQPLIDEGFQVQIKG